MRCSIRARSRAAGSVRCRMGTCVRAGGAVRVSRTEFSFRSRWTGLKDEVPGKSTGSRTGCQTVAFPGAWRLVFRRGYRCDHLLLVVLRVAAVVVGAHEGRVVDRAGKIVAEVVADERVGRIARTAAIRTVELGIPIVFRQSNVMPDWLERRRVELDARVDAVIGRAIGRECARVVGVLAVQAKPRGGRGRTRGRTREPPVIEGNAYGTVGRHCQVRLELVDVADEIVVDLDWRTPAAALIVGRRE